jgi:hypothetical protein
MAQVWKVLASSLYYYKALGKTSKNGTKDKTSGKQPAHWNYFKRKLHRTISS